MNRLGKGFFGQSYGWVYHVLSLKSCVAYFNSSILLGNYFTRLGSKSYPIKHCSSVQSEA